MGFNSDYDIDDYKIDEQLIDTDSNKKSDETIIQKKINDNNLEYKIFTTEYDEIIKQKI